MGEEFYFNRDVRKLVCLSTTSSFFGGKKNSPHQSEKGIDYCLYIYIAINRSVYSYLFLMLINPHCHTSTWTSKQMSESLTQCNYQTSLVRITIIQSIYTQTMTAFFLMYTHTYIPKRSSSSFSIQNQFRTFLPFPHDENTLNTNSLRRRNNNQPTAHRHRTRRRRAIPKRIRRRRTHSSRGINTIISRADHNLRAHCAAQTLHLGTGDVRSAGLDFVNFRHGHGDGKGAVCCFELRAGCGVGTGACFGEDIGGGSGFDDG